MDMMSVLMWITAGACLFVPRIDSQEFRRLPIASRRRLPTVIITREHLRQRENPYGTYGDTAAEFVVSAGLDNSRNSAVRIRRIGGRHDNATEIFRPDVDRIRFPNSTRGPSYNYNGFEQRFRKPENQNTNFISNIPLPVGNNRYNLNERRDNAITIERRHQFDSNSQRIAPVGVFYRSPNRSPSRPAESLDPNRSPPRPAESPNLARSPPRPVESPNPNRSPPRPVESPNPNRSPPRPVESPNPNRSPSRPVESTNHAYRPQPFAPNFPQNINFRVPGASNLRPPNEIAIQRRLESSRKDNQYPIVSVKYSTSVVTSGVEQKQQARPVFHPSNKDNLHRKSPVAGRDRTESHARTENKFPYDIFNNSSTSQKDKPTVTNSYDHLYVNVQNPPAHDSSPGNRKTELTSDAHIPKLAPENNKAPVGITQTPETTKDSDLKNRLTNATSFLDGKSRSPVVESAVSHKSIVAETQPLQLNNVRQDGAQTRLIRKPSIVLRDQITVNELPKKSDRTRYGPRALEISDDIYTSARRKRQVETSVTSDDTESERVIFDNLSTKDPAEAKSKESKRRGRYNFKLDVNRSHTDKKTLKSNFSSHSINDSKHEKIPSFVTNVNEQVVFRKQELEEKLPDGMVYDIEEESPDSDVMSFSDFLASPIAEKIRLERKSTFKDSNFSRGHSPQNISSDLEYDSRSLKNNVTMTYLRNLIAAKLLHTLLSLSHMSSNYSNILKAGRAIENISPSEQRQFGIMVSPYEGQESVNVKSSSPTFRVLKGKIVSLPDLPSELIPIILGTYKPSYTEEQEESRYQEDSTITDDALDNAIYTLLQNEELLNMQPVIKKSPSMSNKGHRKSPSVKYVGSLKTNEPRPSYAYKPQEEWSVGPRCDRLTEEICLDDSDYPSSAIMSSIYKDKQRFDLMYAEVKVRESQVEGLSRQQETAYSFDHYYGSYPQASGSNLVAKDYGPSGGFVCPSEVHYARPHRAKNRKGEWKVVVNVGEYTQTLRMEKCLASGSPCKYVVPQVQSSCSQVFSYHRMLVFNKENGLHIDVFRIPTSCTCHLRPGQHNMYNPKLSASAPFLIRPSPFDEYGGHVENAHPPHVLAEGPNMLLDKKKNSFSSTLWAILGGGQQASQLAQQPQFLDEVQKQIMWTNQLKQFPHLMKQISPNQVLKQLLEDEEEELGIRRQRLRQRAKLDHLLNGGFASHQVPIAVPLPPPPPPPNGIHRRPVVSAVPMDQKHHYPDAAETTKVFSLTRDGPRPAFDQGYRKPYKFAAPPHANHKNTYKVRPGMYPPQSENVQIPESSLHPVAPQFADGRIRPVVQPAQGHRGYDRIVADEDLIAVEKSSDGAHVYVKQPERDNPRDTASEESDSKVNFSYHPILEYLNM